MPRRADHLTLRPDFVSNFAGRFVSVDVMFLDHACPHCGWSAWEGNAKCKMKTAKQSVERRMRSCSLAQSGDDGNKALSLVRFVFEVDSLPGRCLKDEIGELPGAERFGRPGVQFPFLLWAMQRDFEIGLTGGSAYLH